MRVRCLLSFVILETSLFAALCALALTMGAEQLFCGHFQPLLTPLHGLVAGGTLLEYNVHRLYNARSHSDAPAQSRRERAVHVIFGLVGLLISCWGVAGLSGLCLVLGGTFGMLALAYSAPLLPFARKRLKDFGLIKITVLTSVWVGVTTVLPAAQCDYWGPLLWIECLLRALLIFPLCIAFDLRDVAADKLHGIRTLPNTVGVRQSYRIMHGLILLFLLCGTAWWLSRSNLRFIGVIVAAAVAAFAATTAARTSQRPFTYLFLIDGVMLLYGSGQLLARS